MFQIVWNIEIMYPLWLYIHHSIFTSTRLQTVHAEDDRVKINKIWKIKKLLKYCRNFSIRLYRWRSWKWECRFIYLYLQKLIFTEYWWYWYFVDYLILITHTAQSFIIHIIFFDYKFMDPGWKANMTEFFFIMPLAI